MAVPTALSPRWNIPCLGDILRVFIVAILLGLSNFSAAIPVLGRADALVIVADGADERRRRVEVVGVANAVVCVFALFSFIGEAPLIFDDESTFGVRGLSQNGILLGFFATVATPEFSSVVALPLVLAMAGEEELGIFVAVCGGNSEDKERLWEVAVAAA